MTDGGFLFQNQANNNLRNPKVYNPPMEKEKITVPKIYKILSIMVVIFLGLLYLFFFSSIFSVKNIEYLGNMNDNIKLVIEKYRSRNIFTINSSKIEKELMAQNSEFDNVDIYLGLPDTLRIRFQQRDPKIIWQTEGNSYLIDTKGYLYSKSAGIENLPLIVDNKNLSVQIPSFVVLPSFVEFVRNANSKLSEAGIVINKFQVNETTFQIDALTDKNFKIIFDTTRPLSDQMDAFNKAYEQNKDKIKEYVDVRVEGWVYYK